VVAGGLRYSRVGDIALGRTLVLLKAAGFDVELAFIRRPLFETTLLGTVRLVPAWMLQGHDAILAVDIALQEVRGAIVTLNSKKSPDLSKVSVAHTQAWRPGERHLKGEDLVTHIAGARHLKALVRPISTSREFGNIYRANRVNCLPTHQSVVRGLRLAAIHRVSASGCSGSRRSLSFLTTA
jgi:hypothetical protein